MTTLRVFSRAYALIHALRGVIPSLTVGAVLTGQISTASAHPEDDWQDQDIVFIDAYPLAGLHVGFFNEVRHFANAALALQACITRVAELGLAADQCNNNVLNETTRFVSTGRLYFPGSGPSTLPSESVQLIYYYDGYYLEFKAPRACETDGNPCALASGNKTQSEVDYVAPGPFPIEFRRFYSSLGANGSDPVLGVRWRHSYSRGVNQTGAYQANPGVSRSSTYATPEQACAAGWAAHRLLAYGAELRDGTSSYAGNGTCRIERAGTLAIELPIHSGNPYLAREVPRDEILLVTERGTEQRFIAATQGWEHESLPQLKLEEVAEGRVFTREDGSRETYDLAGRLILIRDAGGRTQTLTYDLAPDFGGDGDPFTLDQITHSFGYSVEFFYDELGRIRQLQTPQEILSYSYDTAGNLAAVIHEDGSSKEYLYEQAGLPHHLTGIVDENGDRFASWTYDLATGKALSSEHFGGVQRNVFSYLPDGDAEVTSVLGQRTTYHYEWVGGAKRLQSTSGARCIDCNHESTQSRGYNPDGTVARETDWNGNVREFSYDAGFLSAITEAPGTAQERTTTVQWDTELALPLTLTSAETRSQMAYDGAGRLISFTVSDLGGENARTQTYTYDAQGRVLVIDGPRADVDDSTRFEYAANGRLSSARNGAGHLTQILEYSEGGYPQLIALPNGALERRTYSARGWLLQRSIDDAVTQYEYDNVGQVIAVVAPNGVRQSFEYDGAHSLVAAMDALGNLRSYSFDDANNLTNTEFYSPTGSLTFAQEHTYDALGQFIETTNGTQGSGNRFSYDGAGNLLQITDDLDHSTRVQLDVLSRVTTLVDRLQGETQFGYDDGDHVTSVTDPTGITSRFETNAMGEIAVVDSPDGGLATLTHDAAGNVVTRTDGRGITATYGYDALGRLVSQSYPDPAENVTYHYDEGPVGPAAVGQLTRVDEQSGTTVMTYNPLGQITRDTRTLDGITYEVGYAFDLSGQLTAMTYPSGRVIRIERDPLGRITALSGHNSSGQEVLASGLQYLPWGPLTELTYGNGLTVSNDFDDSYRLTRSSTPAVADLDYSYDGRGNVVSVTDPLNPSQYAEFFYDDLSRLTDALGPFGDLSFTYDSVGNRLSASVDGEMTIFGYDAASHRLRQAQGAQPSEFSYDEAGNVVTRDDLAFTYNQQNRLATAFRSDMTAQYAYNFKGERTSKIVDGSRTHYVYDLDSRLIAEADEQGEITREYVYLAGQPLAIYQRTRSAAPPVPVSQEIDDAHSGTRAVGKWHRRSWSQAYGGAHQTARGHTGSRFVWKAGVPAGRYAVDVRWVAHPHAATDAPYIINHGGQRTRVLVDQTQPGDQWYRLGEFDFAGAGNEGLILRDSRGGVSADAVRIEKIPDTAPGLGEFALYYVHNDLRGAPVVLTDTLGTPRWTAHYSPFGLAIPEIDEVEQPLRLPGQVFDPETGLHYNHMRTYDPQLGRYLQSDPMGIQAGLNTYAYAGNNPLKYVDPLGLEQVRAVEGNLYGYSVGVFAQVSPAPSSHLAALAGLTPLGLALRVPKLEDVGVFIDRPTQGLNLPSTDSPNFYQELGLFMYNNLKLLFRFTGASNRCAFDRDGNRTRLGFAVAGVEVDDDLERVTVQFGRDATTSLVSQEHRTTQSASVLDGVNAVKRLAGSVHDFVSSF